MSHIFFFTFPYNVYARAYWRTAGYAPAFSIILMSLDLLLVIMSLVAIFFHNNLQVRITDLLYIFKQILSTAPNVT